MRTAAAVVFGFALSTAAFGADGVPSKQVLADLGLSGLQILSDDQAMDIRGSGFQPGASWNAKLLATIAKLEQQVNGLTTKVLNLDKSSDLRKDVLKFHKYARNIRRTVKKFEHIVHPKDHHSGMHPPKMSHGGKPW
jgi:hypothetical protein